jgi:hypothetical protein
LPKRLERGYSDNAYLRKPMNSILKAIAVLGVSAALSGLSSVGYAQQSKPAPTQSKPSVTNEATPETVTPLNTQPDLNLLAKTVTNFIKSDRYQTESELQLTGKVSGTSLSTSVQIKTITQSPRQFRSEISFTGLEDGKERRYLVVSNGDRVWTYRPDVNQYAVMDYQSFDKSRDTFLIGMSSYLFLIIAPDFRELMAQRQLSDADFSAILSQMLQSKNVPIKGGRRNFQARDYYVYEYTDPKAGYSFNAFVVPETATVEQIQINGRSEGTEIVLKEKIIRRVENPAIAPDTFSFSLPLGAKEVESIPLQPF